MESSDPLSLGNWCDVTLLALLCGVNVIIYTALGTRFSGRAAWLKRGEGVLRVPGPVASDVEAGGRGTWQWFRRVRNLA